MVATSHVDAAAHRAGLTSHSAYRRVHSQTAARLGRLLPSNVQEPKDADLLLRVIDASHPAWEEHRQVVNGVLEEIGVTETPVLHVFNKTDLLEQEDVIALHERIELLLPNAVFVSALEPDGLEPLRRSLLAEARRLRR